jgi:hydroxypyruvate isomerase
VSNDLNGPNGRFEIPQTLRFAVNLSMLFTEFRAEDRPSAAAAAGFDAIECWWPFRSPIPPDVEVENFISGVEEAGLALIALNFYAGDLENGDRGVLSIPAAQHDFCDSVDVLVAIAQRTGCRRFNALYGQRMPDLNPEEQDEVALANLVVAADAVGDLGGIVLLEPLTLGENGDYPLLSSRDVRHVLSLGAPLTRDGNVAMLADLYHITRNGENVMRVLEECRDQIGHVQLADVPRRSAPGSGVMDVEPVFKQLAELNYSGHIGLEYRPYGASITSLEWLPVVRRSSGVPRRTASG